MTMLDIRTPLIAPKKNLCVKLEHMNPAGSHKARAARRIVQQAISLGELEPGGKRRILEKSGGNFGVGLAYEAAKHNIGVDLVIGLSFSQLKRNLCKEYGASLVGRNLLHEGLQPKEVVANLLETRGEEYYFTDQFANPWNFEAHLLETAPEIATQIEAHVESFSGISLVLAAGTGAHAAAINTVLSQRFVDVELVLVQPQNCCFESGQFGDHLQQGAAVGVMPPFLNFADVAQVQPVSDLEAVQGQRLMAKDTGIYPGPTGGANYFAASRIAKTSQDRLVVTMTYDAGEGYLG